MQYINAVLAHRHAQAATIRAKQELELLNHTPSSQMEAESLRHQVAERQQRVCELQAMLEGCGQDKLTDLLQEMAALQVTRVLHGDYDLKIARQDAFISKQDQVEIITCTDYVQHTITLFVCCCCCFCLSLFVVVVGYVFVVVGYVFVVVGYVFVVVVVLG